MTDEVTGVGVIGINNMGSNHLKDLMEIKNAKLVAVCDLNRERSNLSAKQYKVRSYHDHKQLLKDPEIEAIIVATPHFSHTPISIDAFDMGIHVLVEKPVGVHIKDVKKTIHAYEEALKKKKDLVFSAMFQQRTYGYWRKIKEMIDTGELGKLIRASWIITNWFRTQHYYDSGEWRATWKGEGGGVLLNQCPHNLDLFQWFVGVPDRITSFASFGKYHDIEVEDEVTAYLEYDNGMTGHFITSTAESPGTNRLEIVGENGKLVFEDNKLTFSRNNQSCLDRIKNSVKSFDSPAFSEITVPYEHHGKPGHGLIIQNFINAIQGKEKLFVDAKEGLNSVMMSNAMLLSSREGKTVNLPIDEDDFEAYLESLIRNSDLK